MTYVPDLEPLGYFGVHSVDRLRAVGWLAPAWVPEGRSHPRGTVPETTLERLVNLMEWDLEPMAFRGYHPCGLCHAPHCPVPFDHGGKTFDLGARNLWVPGNNIIFVAPSLVLHYVVEHEYKPPEVFLQAVSHLEPWNRAAVEVALQALLPELFGHTGIGWKDRETRRVQATQVTATP